MAELATPEKVDVVAVPFHGDDILTVEVKGKVHVILKPALDQLGIDYWTQVQKLRSRSWATTSQRPVVAGDGKIREMLTCDVQTFLMLLANVDERRVAAEVQPKLIAYQMEVAHAIEDYWTKGKAVNPRVADLSPARQLLQTVQLLVDHEERIAAQERQVKQIRGDVNELGARMDGIEQKTGWVSALGFAKKRGLATDPNSVQRLGIAASRVCRSRGIKPKKVDHAALGEVNIYPVECLEQAAGLAPA